MLGPSFNRLIVKEQPENVFGLDKLAIDSAEVQYHISDISDFSDGPFKKIASRENHRAFFLIIRPEIKHFSSFTPLKNILAALKKILPALKKILPALKKILPALKKILQR